MTDAEIDALTANITKISDKLLRATDAMVEKFSGRLVEMRAEETFRARIVAYKPMRVQRIASG